ncbi:hypothetical protein TU79_21140 [Pseudomonas trivialis]|uniref:Uncharacterized protein n=1 Tax=Pseudomonas trivialis TaxID=200450 RepID=A0A0R2ZIH3_9PSED|nr:hypothetical protein TU79_21140 [Pseudomonas trivialis]
MLVRQQQPQIQKKTTGARKTIINWQPIACAPQVMYTEKVLPLEIRQNHWLKNLNWLESRPDAERWPLHQFCQTQ